MENYGEKIARGSAFLVVMSVLASLVGYLTRMILSRNLPKEDFGLFYSVLAFVGMTTILYDLGLTNAVARFSSFYSARKQYGKVKETLLVAILVRGFLSLLVLGVVLIFSDEISMVFFHTENNEVLVVLMLATIIGILYSIFLSYIQGMRMIYFFGMGEFLRNTMSFLFVVALLSKGLVGVCYAYLFANTIVSLFFLVISIKKTNYVLKENVKLEISHVLKIFSYSIPLFLAGFGGLIVSYTDTLMITYFKGLEQAAYYQIAMPTSRILWNFVTSLLPVIFPLVTAMVSLRDTKDFKLTFELLSKITMFFVVPASFLMFIYPKIIITILFGPSYTRAAEILRILSFIAVFYSFNAIVTSFLSAEGNTKRVSKIIGMMAVFNFFSNLALIPNFGSVGAALATLASYIFGFYMFSREARRLKLPFNYLNIAKFIFSGIVFAFIVSVLKSILNLNPYLEMFLIIPTSFLFYIFIVFKLSIINRVEMKILSRLFRKIF